MWKIEVYVCFKKQILVGFFNLEDISNSDNVLNYRYMQKVLIKEKYIIIKEL